MGLLLLPIFVVFVLVVSLVGWLLGKLVAKWRHSARWGVGAFFLVWAAVLGPEVFVHAQLRYLCKTQGGVHVYETISEPKSLYYQEDGTIVEQRWVISAKPYLDDGYDSIENRLYKGDLYRFWRDKDGQIKRVKIAQPTSHYEQSYQLGIPVTKYIWINKQTIRDRYTGKVVAVYKNFGMAGGLLTAPLLSQIGVGTGSYCELPGKDLKEIYPKSIQPTR